VGRAGQRDQPRLIALVAASVILISLGAGCVPQSPSALQRSAVPQSVSVAKPGPSEPVLRWVVEVQGDQPATGPDGAIWVFNPESGDLLTLNPHDDRP
jgi:hypothetical protein